MASNSAQPCHEAGLHGLPASSWHIGHPAAEPLCRSGPQRHSPAAPIRRMDGKRAEFLAVGEIASPRRCNVDGVAARLRSLRGLLRLARVKVDGPKRSTRLPDPREYPPDVHRWMSAIQSSTWQPSAGPCGENGSSYGRDRFGFHPLKKPDRSARHLNRKFWSLLLTGKI